MRILHSSFVHKALMMCMMSAFFITAHAELTDNGEYYIWLNIYEKLLGEQPVTNEVGEVTDIIPGLCKYAKAKDASYIYVAEASSVSGYVLLRQKSTGKYLAASSSNSYGVVFDQPRSTDDARFLWKADEGTYTYLTNKKSGKYVGVDGGNKDEQYVSIYCDKPKGSHSQFSVIPATGGVWTDALYAYESPEYTNAQGVKEIDYCRMKDRTVNRSDAIDIHITSNMAPMLGKTKINLGSDRTWLIIDNFVPSDVIENYLSYVTINGRKAVNGSNCRVAIYLNGAAIIPIPENVMTCSGTAGDFTLAVGNHTNLKKQSNTMTSFVLRRGYMATLATATEGAGYSRVYVADHADLEVTLPKALTERVTSVYVKQWQYLSKKGWGHLGGSGGTDKLRATWFWTWSADQSSTNDFEYVPCKQHRYWPSANDVNSHTSTASLSLNEPEHSEQHTSDQCSCGGTIDAWTAYLLSPNFLPSGGRIGSPQPTDLSYLTTFCEHVDNNAKRCDFAVTHAYWDMTEGSSYNATTYANWFCNTKCKSVWNNTGRPLWLTEMEISASWNTNKVTSYEQNREYLQVLLQKIDESPWIERYAIYGTDMWQTYMFYDANTSKGLTPAGQVYRDHRATFAYNANYIKVPTWWEPSIQTPTLTYVINATKNTITFSIVNKNGDATKTLALQHKVNDEWVDLYSVTDRSEFENTTLTHTFSLDDIDRENEVFRVAVTNLYGKSATSDEQSTSFIVNPNIETTSKDNVKGWTCERNAEAGYTKAASGDTYLEVWNATAAAIDFNYYQDIADIPNGVYALSAVCFNSMDHKEGTINGAMGLYATADGVSYFAPVTIDSEIDYNQLTTIPTIVVRNNTMRIGIRNIGRMTGRWAGADNFALTYLGTEEDVLEGTYEDAVKAADQSIVAVFPTLEDEQRDATGLIFNPDLARANGLFWTASNLDIAKGEAYNGDANKSYFNIWKGSTYSSSVEQDLTCMPEGEYTLSVLLRGSAEKVLTLKAIHTSADGDATAYTQEATGTGAATVSGSDYLNGWQKVELEPITIHHGDLLTIGAAFNPTGGGWWSADHFQMTYTPLPEEEPDAIDHIRTSAPSTAVSTYHTLDGRQVKGTPTPGIYILRKADGTTRKVLIR